MAKNNVKTVQTVNGTANNNRLQDLQEKFKKYIGTDAPDSLPESALETIVAKFERKTAEKVTSLKDVLSETFVPLEAFCAENAVDAENLYKLASVLKLSVRHIGDFLKDVSDTPTKTIADLGINANFSDAFQFLVSRVLYIHSQLAQMGIVNAEVLPATDINLNDVPSRGYTFTEAEEATEEATK